MEEAKNLLIRMTHGHEQWLGHYLRVWGGGLGGGGMRGEDQENCNSIIHKI